MTAAAKVRSTSRLVATKPGCNPLKVAYALAVDKKPKSWTDIEPLFLAGMQGFDENIASGLADMGDLQNGKGDFFNDILALLLENCAQVTLYSRGGVPGLIFPKHNLDVSYPKTGPVQFTLEAKAVGTPKHPGSPLEDSIGRPGAADLDKRVKELAFKAIDLKAEHARMMTGQGESPTPIAGDLTTWLHSVRPRSYLFITARVVSQGDRDRVVQFARIAGQVTDAVGVYCFGPTAPDKPTTYRSEPVPSDVAIDRVLFRACQDLSALRSAEERS